MTSFSVAEIVAQWGVRRKGITKIRLEMPTPQKPNQLFREKARWAKWKRFMRSTKAVGSTHFVGAAIPALLQKSKHGTACIFKQTIARQLLPKRRFSFLWWRNKCCFESCMQKAKLILSRGPSLNLGLSPCWVLCLEWA